MDIIEINLSSLEDFKEKELSNNCSYNIKHYDLNFCFYIKQLSKSDKLIVLGQGAVDRKSKSLPNYQRISWLDELQCNCIIIQDPTLFMYENLPLGWCQGNKNQNAIPGFIEIIEHVTKSLNIEYNNLCFYGSSAGGFSSLIFSPFFEGATVIVNNPQTNVLKYHKPNVRTLLRECFDNITFEEYEAKHSYYSAEKVISEKKYLPTIFYYQNIADEFHLREHLIPFIRDIKNINLMDAYHKINIKLYDDPKTGHNPLSKDQTINIIEHHFLDKKKQNIVDVISHGLDHNNVFFDENEISISTIIKNRDNEAFSINEILKVGSTCKETIVIFRYEEPNDTSLQILKKHGVKSISIPNKSYGFCLNFLIKKAKNKNILLLDETVSYKINYYTEKNIVCNKAAKQHKPSVFINYCSFSKGIKHKISSIIISNKESICFPSDDSDIKTLIGKLDKNISIHEIRDLSSSVFEDENSEKNIYFHDTPLREGSVDIQELKEIFL